MPLLRIGLPVFNGEAFLEECLDNLLDQTFTDFEVVIGDNASTDRTQEICERYCARDDRFRVIRHPSNLGAAMNYNKVAEGCTTKYLKWVAVDDLMEPGYLQACIEVLEGDDSIVLCHTGTVLIGTDRAPAPRDEASGMYLVEYGKLRHGEPPVPAGTSSDPVERFRSVGVEMIRCLDIFGVIRTEALRGSRMHDLYYGSDRVLLVELALKGRFHRVAEPWFLSREHAAQSTNLPDVKTKNRWNDTSGRTHLPMVIPREIMRRVVESDLSLGDKARCLALYAKGANWGRLIGRRKRKSYLPA